MNKQLWEIMQEQMDIITNAARKASQESSKVLLKPEMIKEPTREERVINFYAHDFRDMKMSEENIKELLGSFVEALECDHQCSSNCRRNGCNCACGEYHF